MIDCSLWLVDNAYPLVIAFSIVDRFSFDDRVSSSAVRLSHLTTAVQYLIGGTSTLPSGIDSSAPLHMAQYIFLYVI